VAAPGQAPQGLARDGSDRVSDPLEMFGLIQFPDATLVTLYPPTEQDRIRNEFDLHAQNVLTQHMTAIFGDKWPSEN
jgi:hypothetical protein